jgi:hypothetical protein
LCNILKGVEMSTQPEYNSDESQAQFETLGSDFNLPLWQNFATDVRSMAVPSDVHTIRELVKIYYRIQKDRMACANQSRQLEKLGKSNELTEHIAKNLQYMERSLIYPFRYFSNSYVAGRWSISQYGIGPVITAGLLSNIDISKAPTVGSIWRFAGMDPTVVWAKGEKRPWNDDLKTLVWKIGQSFMKFSNNDACFYGKLYKQDKQRRINLNESGAYAENAKRILESKNWRANKSRDTLSSGMLPPAQIDAQARRFAAKIFLSHFHTVWYEDYHTELQGKPVRAPRPYAIAHGGHTHMIEIPHYIQAVDGVSVGRFIDPDE